MTINFQTLDIKAGFITKNLHQCIFDIVETDGQSIIAIHLIKAQRIIEILLLGNSIVFEYPDIEFEPEKI